jgi:hypothetical protein
MDDALFNSIRLGAGYFTVAGPDLGLDADDVARMVYIRRALQGATRPQPRIALLDRMRWDARDSLCHIGARLDQSVAMLCAQHRFDFSCFDLIVLPPCNTVLGTTGGGQGGGYLVPTDSDWYQRLRNAVERGTQLVIFRDTFEGLPGSVRGEIESAFPELFDTRGDDPRDQDVGAGRILYSGCFPWNGPIPDPTLTTHIREHPLVRLLRRLGLSPDRVDSNQAFAHKELLDLHGGHVLLVRGEWTESRTLSLRLNVVSGYTHAYDLSTGEQFPLSSSGRPDWSQLDLPIHPRRGRYLLLQQANRGTSG